MVVVGEELPDCDWYSCSDVPLTLEGIRFRNSQNMLRRMPVCIQDNPDLMRVNSYADHTSGGILRFCTDSSFINISARLKVINNSADIMTYGRIGFDVYTIQDEVYCHAGTTRLNFDEVNFPVHSFRVPLLFDANHSKQLREYEINFPLYGQVEEFMVGFEHDAKILSPSKRKSECPVIWYGTSIVQGCCASRPGLSLTNRLSRKLNGEVLNFGFAGSGKGEAEVAKIISQIDNPLCFIISYDENVSADELEKTLFNFTDILRASHPAIPIVTISKLRMPMESNNSSPERIRRTKIHLANIKHRRELGDDAVVFLDGFSIFSSDLCDCYADCCHPNDQGMAQYINYLYPMLLNILKTEILDIADKAILL